METWNRACLRVLSDLEYQQLSWMHKVVLAQGITIDKYGDVSDDDLVAFTSTCVRVGSVWSV